MTGLVPRDPFTLLVAVLAVVALISLVLALTADLIRWATSIGLFALVGL